MRDPTTLSPTFADLQDELSGWRAGLLVSAKNAPKPILANALIALREAPEWQGFGLRRVCTRNHADEAAAMAKR
jgi:hypothetical protein